MDILDSKSFKDYIGAFVGTEVKKNVALIAGKVDFLVTQVAKLNGLVLEGKPVALTSSPELIVTREFDESSDRDTFSLDPFPPKEEASAKKEPEPSPEMKQFGMTEELKFAKFGTETRAVLHSFKTTGVYEEVPIKIWSTVPIRTEKELIEMGLTGKNFVKLSDIITPTS